MAIPAVSTSCLIVAANRGVRHDAALRTNVGRLLDRYQTGRKALLEAIRGY